MDGTAFGCVSPPCAAEDESLFPPSLLPTRSRSPLLPCSKPPVQRDWAPALRCSASSCAAPSLSRPPHCPLILRKNRIITQSSPDHHSITPNHHPINTQGQRRPHCQRDPLRPLGAPSPPGRPQRASGGGPGPRRRSDDGAARQALPRVPRHGRGGAAGRCGGVPRILPKRRRGEGEDLHAREPRREMHHKCITASLWFDSTDMCDVYIGGIVSSLSTRSCATWSPRRTGTSWRSPWRAPSARSHTPSPATPRLLCTC